MTDGGRGRMGKRRDEVFGISDIKTELVEIPEWGMTFEVRGLTGAQRAAIAADASDLRQLYPDLIIASCHDPETGEPDFAPEDREWLLEKSAAALEKLVSAAIRLSGLGPQAVADATKN